MSKPWQENVTGTRQADRPARRSGQRKHMIVKVTKMFLRSVFTALETTTTSTQCSRLESMTHG